MRTRFNGWLNQWRHYYDVPARHHRDQLPRRRPLLPHPQRSNPHFEQPTSVIPDHMQILQACWGRSASRHSQGDPSLSLLTTATQPTTRSSTSPCCQRPDTDPVPQPNHPPRRAWICQYRTRYYDQKKFWTTSRGFNSGCIQLAETWTDEPGIAVFLTLRPQMLTSTYFTYCFF